MFSYGSTGSVARDFQTQNQTPQRNPSNLQNSAYLSQYRPSFVASPNLNVSTIPKYNVEPDIEEIHKRYEEEAREIKLKYDQHLQAHLKVGRRIEEVEAILEEERRMNGEWKMKYHQAEEELQEERRLRIQLDQRVQFLTEENRNKDQTITELEMKQRSFQKDTDQLIGENTRLKEELSRLHDFYNNRFREIEEGANNRVRQVFAQNESLKGQIEREKVDHGARLKDLNNEWELKYKKSDDQIRELNRVITELDQEVRLLNEHIQRLKAEHEEHLRMNANQVRKEEYDKYQVTLRQVEAKLRASEDAREALLKKIDEMYRDLHTLEKELNNTKLQYEQEHSRLKAESNELKNQLVLSNNLVDKLRSDLLNRDTQITKLQSEIKNQEIEANRIRDQHSVELDHMRNEFMLDKKRYDDIEQGLRQRIADLENLVRETEDDAARIRAEYNRLRDIINGNVAKTIMQTFTEYETKATPNIKSSQSLQKTYGTERPWMSGIKN